MNAKVEISEGAYGLADRHLVRHGDVTCVVGLPEQTVAMVFAMYSRSERPIRETLAGMIGRGEINVPESHEGAVPSERERKFHETTTIGYNHKSVGDHATVHFAVEGASMVVERDFLDARLLAATSQSTRFVDFRRAGFVTPEENWRGCSADEYRDHCQWLVDSYAGLKELAVEAVREVAPYNPDHGWKSERGWEQACEKRALDAIRDLLPASVRSMFGVTMSATGAREFLDKRDTGADWQPREVSARAADVRAACRSALPTLLPEGPRYCPRPPRPRPLWYSGSQPQLLGTRHHRQDLVSVLRTPDWDLVQNLAGVSVPELVDRWRSERGHHMVPDRSSEFPVYSFRLGTSFAISRDLGRHRMATRVDGLLTPMLGYTADPLFSDAVSLSRSQALRRLADRRQGVVLACDERLSRWAASGMHHSVLQYACPMAAMVLSTWQCSLRELIHIIGLRTTKQGHPSYRAVVQQLARELINRDPMVAPLIRDVVNFEYVTVGRPG